MLDQKYIQILKEIISYKTVNNADECQKVFELMKKEMPKSFTSKTFTKNGKTSIFFTNTTSKNLDILIASHIDVVPVTTDSLFDLKIKNDRAFGRGVFDMKGPLIGELKAIKEFFNQNRKLKFGLLVTSDEEHGGFNGAGHFVKEKIANPKIVIVADGGDSFDVVVEEKGVLNLSLSYKGKTAHSARPWEGDNAAKELVEVIKKITDNYPIGSKDKWQTTASLVNFSSSSGTGNVVPDLAEAQIDFRYISDTTSKEIIDTIKKFNPKVKITINAEGNAFITPTDGKYFEQYLQSLKKVIKKEPKLIKYFAGCDGRFFTYKNIPVIINRPKGGNPHKDNEWVSLSSLDTFSQVLHTYFEDVEKLNK